MPIQAKRREVQPQPLSGAALNSAKSFTLGIEDVTNVLLHYSYTYSAATSLSFKIEVQSYGGVWRELDKVSTSSSVISKFSPLTLTTGAANHAGALPRIPVSGKNLRVTITGASADASDLISVEVELEY